MSIYKVIIVLFIYVYMSVIPIKYVYTKVVIGVRPQADVKNLILKIRKIPNIYKNKVKAKSTNQILSGSEKYW